MANSERPHDEDRFWKRNLDKIGIGGSIFAALLLLLLRTFLSRSKQFATGLPRSSASVSPSLIRSNTSAGYITPT